MKRWTLLTRFKNGPMSKHTTTDSRDMIGAHDAFRYQFGELPASFVA